MIFENDDGSKLILREYGILLVVLPDAKYDSTPRKIFKDPDKSDFNYREEEC